MFRSNFHVNLTTVVYFKALILDIFTSFEVFHIREDLVAKNGVFI